MSEFKKLAVFLLTFIMVLSIIPMTSMAANDGWFTIDGVWYYLKNGDPVKGWQKIGGKWYYFYEDYGEMMDYPSFNYKGTTYVFEQSGALRDNKTGWFTTNYGGEKYSFYVKKDGIATTGWKKISGKWYYFESEGPMLDPTADWAKDSFDVTKLDKNSYKAVVEYDLYFFNKDGSLKTNSWVKYDSSWFYLDKNGIPVTGWKQIDKKWYYFYKDGAMKADGWIHSEDDEWYYVGKDGAMVTNSWVLDTTSSEGGWCYQDKNGRSVLGWLKLNKKWYYLDGGFGYCLMNTSKEIGGKVYNFDKDGVCLNP